MPRLALAITRWMSALALCSESRSSMPNSATAVWNRKSPDGSGLAGAHGVRDLAADEAIGLLVPNPHVQELLAVRLVAPAHGWARAARRAARCDEYNPSRRSSVPSSPGLEHRAASWRIRRLYATVSRRRWAFATTSTSPCTGGRYHHHRHRQLSHALYTKLSDGRCLTILAERGPPNQASDINRTGCSNVAEVRTVSTHSRRRPREITYGTLISLVLS